ncbi:MAG: hypothetical protein WBG92_21435 [Thiohalocapsa sp.]
MLELIARIARGMRPAAPVLGAVGFGLVLLCGGLILFAPGDSGDHLLLPAIAALVWCLCGYVFVQAFETVPAVPGPQLRGWQRFRRLIARGWHWLLAGVFLSATVAALSLTSRIIGEFLD